MYVDQLVCFQSSGQNQTAVTSSAVTHGRGPSACCSG